MDEDILFEHIDKKPVEWGHVKKAERPSFDKPAKRPDATAEFVQRQVFGQTPEEMHKSFDNFRVAVGGKADEDPMDSTAIEDLAVAISQLYHFASFVGWKDPTWGIFHGLIQAALAYLDAHARAGVQGKHGESVGAVKSGLKKAAQQPAQGGAVAKGSGWEAVEASLSVIASTPPKQKGAPKPRGGSHNKASNNLWPWDESVG